MFRSVTFKLTSYYLLIITVICVGFSLAVYQIGTNDLAFGLQLQTERITNNFPVFTNSPYLRADREQREGDHRLLGRLIVLNVVVLAAAGFASYALARRTLEPIAAAHERQKRFTADVSHELRTPLTALQMESEVILLDKNASKADLRAVVESNVEEANKLTALTANLLRLSQLEAGDSLQNELVELDQVVVAATSQVTRIAADKTITIDTQTVPVQVRGEATALAQLLVILLDNAIKYSQPQSSITVTMQLTGDVIDVSVSDHGTGIAKADLNHVFERFYRADNARSGNQTNNSGYGLGLSIASLIADSHDGRLSITSQQGKGTVAHFTMTVAKP